MREAWFSRALFDADLPASISRGAPRDASGAASRAMSRTRQSAPGNCFAAQRNIGFGALRAQKLSDQN
ncbi:hypothetical protein B1812_22195 (plasmid) [Methylocystis bryophila]|uniref:Uncharacterized protein n=1 Tax=Methylocystis bryophila TaxID=655015 RepID=A0A1W6N2C5_9HYPH|nr:hypothetical protein B1812_22195 [Methylocystis bryophila]